MATSGSNNAAGVKSSKRGAEDVASSAHKRQKLDYSKPVNTKSED